jgi:hypothetical protein
MGSSRFLPLVIAGLIGLFVGWLFAPDVDDVTEAANGRFDQIDARLAAIEAPLAAIQTSLAAVDQRTSATEAAIQAIGNPAEASAALSTKLDAVAASAGEGKAATDGVVAALAALQAKLDAAAAAPPPAPAAPEPDAGTALAGQIGNTGAILLPGQTAIFGAKRVTLAALAEGTASMGPEGAAPADVASGASVDLGDGCSVTLVGVTATAAYLAPTGCAAADGAPAAPAAAPAPAAEPAAPAAAAPAEAPAAAAPPAAAEAPAPAAAEAPAAAAPAAPAAPAAEAAAPAATADGTPLSTGQTGTFGDKRAFVSRISAADNRVFLFVPGKGQVPVATGEAADLGDGCMVTLTGIDGTTATFSTEGCGGDAAAPADAAAAPADAAAAPAAAPAAPAAAAPAAPAPAAPAPAEAPAAPAAPAAAAAPEAPAPAAPAPAAPTEEAARAAAGGDAPAPTQTAAGGPAQLTIGQTATFGDKRVFLSRVTPEQAFVVVVGQGNQEVAKGAALDLGDGCSATYDGLNDKTASFTPSGC